MDDELCTICSLPNGDAHKGRRHMFVAPGTRVDTSQFAAKRPKGDAMSDDKGEQGENTYSVSGMLFDPVLRQALVDKGVITPQDLTEAQMKIAAITQNVMGGGPNG